VPSAAEKRAYDRAYRERHKERIRERQRVWRANNPEKVAASQRRYRQSHPERRKAAKIKKLYGLEPAAYAQLVAEQEGRCSICRDEAALHVDHDHVTGKVRALLCGTCNRGLGHFKDNPVLLRAAITYLEAHGY
jgi:hypothetical protein